MIRTDAGSGVAAPPADMLAIRAGVDSRNNQPNPTAIYSDLYQTSQNPLFGWLTDGAGGPYDINEPGAWTLTLAAYEAGALRRRQHLHSHLWPELRCAAGGL